MVGDELIREAARLRVLAIGQLTKFRAKYEEFWAVGPDEPAHMRADQDAPQDFAEYIMAGVLC